MLLWLFVVSVCLGQIRGAGEKVAEKSYEGILSAGIMAIGGETTGVVLKTKKDDVYELDIRSSKDLRKRAGELGGKNVVIVGDYKPRPGVEIKERPIIEVKTLSEAK